MWFIISMAAAKLESDTCVYPQSWLRVWSLRGQICAVINSAKLKAEPICLLAR